MRWEASRAVAFPQPSHSSPSSIGQMQSLSPSPLPLPWLADPPSLETPPPAPRFDFYTDPTSAFSASKRMRFSNASGGFGPFSPQRPTPPPPPSFPYGKSLIPFLLFVFLSSFLGCKIRFSFCCCCLYSESVEELIHSGKSSARITVLFVCLGGRMLTLY